MTDMDMVGDSGDRIGDDGIVGGIDIGIVYKVILIQNLI